jgi:hypothetical protein
MDMCCTVALIAVKVDIKSRRLMKQNEERANNKERTNKIIQNYAHNYRDMKMTQLELMDMLTVFLAEVLNEK